MDSEIVGTINMADVTVDAMSFTWTVDNAIRSRSSSNLGSASISRVQSFASEVDSAIRSRTPSNLGTSSEHDFASAEDMMRTITVAATNNFSLDNKIGSGSFGVLYRAKLVDGREVAIKKGVSKRNGLFKSKWAFLFQIRHKHLVGLVGFREEKDEWLLVHEYMKNGSLHDHLHHNNNVNKGSSVLNSWKMRIKIALDASRGIKYLHNYVIPSTIHGDVKSSNILLDASWTARVSDFGLKFMKNSAGTVGYIDNYNGLNEYTAKSDVYGLGVVLLELLTGKRAIFKYGEDEGTPLSVVDFAVSAILAGDLDKILDPRVGPPNVNEAEAVELVACAAMLCVTLEGKDRPTMVDIVVNLERALAMCYNNRQCYQTRVKHRFGQDIDWINELGKIQVSHRPEIVPR